ncbi:MAG: hypothetical protein AB7V32_04430 [Candidatus Berkiella sp.]
MRALLGVFCALYGSHLYASNVEVDFLGKLDTIEEHVSDPEKRLKAKYTIIEMMSKCEFDEQCMLNMKSELQQLAQEQKNIMYSAFVKYLDWEKNDLEYNIQHCQIDDKKEVRKVYAKCYQQWVDVEKNHPPQNRGEIDKIENDRNLCLLENMTPLAQKGNIFAQADLVNLGEHFKDAQLMSKWEAKVNEQKGSAKYQQYMKCSEIP